MSTITVTVDHSVGNGSRLDVYCSQKNNSLTRSYLKNRVTHITVNGLPAKLSRTIHFGDKVSIVLQDPVSQKIEPENIPLRILFENEYVTVINKKQGMVTHPAVGNWSGTLVHALLWHWKREIPLDTYRTGIVHRLDKDTSGVIITAKNFETEKKLKLAFKKHRVRKTYIAILCGVPKESSGIIETQIFRDPKNRKRFTWAINSDLGKYAKTSYRVVKTLGNYSLVSFTLHTGRTHQIRVHARYLGTPILGDPIYGKKDKRFSDATLMLHARRLTIRVPGIEALQTISAPVPVRFRSVIENLQEEYPT